MRLINGKHPVQIYVLAILFLFKINFSHAGSAPDKEHFRFPHFFTQSADRAEDFVLRFSKGQMKFSGRRIFFQVIQTKSETVGPADPESIMHVADARTENISLEFVNAIASHPSGAGPLASRSNYFLGNNSSQWKQDLPNFNSLHYQNL